MILPSNGFFGISKPEDFYKNKNNALKSINSLLYVEKNNTFENNVNPRNEETLESVKATLILSTNKNEINEIEEKYTRSQSQSAKLYEITSEKPKEKHAAKSDKITSEKPKEKHAAKSDKKIFKIRKVSQIAGRRSSNKPLMVRVKHGKSAKDNITTKVKTYFINGATKYTNGLYKLYRRKKGKKENILLQKIEPKFSKAYTKEENQNFLNKKMKDIFSMNVSKKCSRFSEDYNLHQINKLYKEEPDAKEVIKIMNSTVKDLYLEYINENKKIKGFNLDEDVKKIEEKYKESDEKYAENFRKVANELIEILSAKGRANSKL